MPLHLGQPNHDSNSPTPLHPKASPIARDLTARRTKSSPGARSAFRRGTARECDGHTARGKAVLYAWVRKIGARCGGALFGFRGGRACTSRQSAAVQRFSIICGAHWWWPQRVAYFPAALIYSRVTLTPSTPVFCSLSRTESVRRGFDVFLSVSSSAL